jgi:hypothetical protein
MVPAITPARNQRGGHLLFRARMEKRKTVRIRGRRTWGPARGRSVQPAGMIKDYFSDLEVVGMVSR